MNMASALIVMDVLLVRGIMSKSNIDRTCFNDIVNLLMPYMDIPETRQAILEAAWYGSPLLYQVNWTGNAQSFTVLAVRRAINFGDIQGGVSAIQILLDGLRSQVGYDVQIKINEILNRCFSKMLNDEFQIELGTLPIADCPLADNHIFISYSRSDRAAFVEGLAKKLTEKGYPLWIDNLGPQYGGITAGESWKQELANALHQAALLIFVMSPDSIRSPWCLAEIRRSAEQNKPIIPLLIRPIDDEDRSIITTIQIGDTWLSELQYRDLITLGYERGLQILLSDIKRNLA